MKLFIDDIRNPSDVGYNDNEFVVLRNAKEAIAFIKAFSPQFISFDHDLGLEETGYDIAKCMVECDLLGAEIFSEDFQFTVHSANPIGAKNIKLLLDNYIAFKYNGDSNVVEC